MILPNFENLCEPNHSLLRGLLFSAFQVASFAAEGLLFIHLNLQELADHHAGITSAESRQWTCTEDHEGDGENV